MLEGHTSLYLDKMASEQRRAEISDSYDDVASYVASHCLRCEISISCKVKKHGIKTFLIPSK